MRHVRALNVVVFGLLVLLCAVMVYAWATPQLVFKTLDVESGRLGWPEGYAEFLREVAIAREDVGPDRLDSAVVPVQWIKDTLFPGTKGAIRTSTIVGEIGLWFPFAAVLVQCVVLAMRIKAGGRTLRALAGDVTVLACICVVMLFVLPGALSHVLLWEQFHFEAQQLGIPQGTDSFFAMVDTANAKVEQGTSTAAIVDRVQIRDGFFPLTIQAIGSAVRTTTLAMAAAAVTASVQGVLFIVRATRTDTPTA